MGVSWAVWLALAAATLSLCRLPAPRRAYRGCCADTYFAVHTNRTWDLLPGRTSYDSGLPICPNCVPIDIQLPCTAQEVRCLRCEHPPCNHPALPRCYGRALVRGRAPRRPERRRWFDRVLWRFHAQDDCAQGR